MKQEGISIELLYKKLENTLSVKEEEEVEKWLEVPAHREYFKRLEHFFYLTERTEVSEQELQEAWQAMYKRAHRHSWQRKRKVLGIVAVAASLVVGLCIWSLFFRSVEKISPEEKIVRILPGKYNAVLELANGQVHRLGEVGIKEKHIDDHILVDSGQLSYIRPDSQRLQINYNKLSVPRGGEYQLKLEDGTKIWLNSDSRLRYPEVFIDKQREVFLEGEAYFEVAEDTCKPFIVHAGNQMIKVLGTGFGITYYADEEVQTVTLVHGKVEVGFNGAVQENIILSPGKQVLYNRENYQVECKEVDVQEYVAWREGKYVFAKKRLEDMLNTLSRWYDFQVFYQNARCKDILFSGEIKRFENFSSILELIQKTSDVRFEITGSMVQVINN